MNLKNKNAARVLAFAVSAAFLASALSIQASAQSADDPGLAPAVTKALIEANGLSKIRDIQYPLATLPEIVGDGALFTIELLSNPERADWITIMLSPTFSEFKSENSFSAKALYISGPAPSRFWVSECEKQVYTIVAQMPKFEEEPKMAECMYDLEVSWSKGSDIQPHSVKIFDEKDGDYNYAVIADFHTGDPRAMANEMTPEGFMKNWGDYWSLGMQYQLISELNAINPEFVICCGDIVFGQMLPEEYGSGGSAPYESGNGENYTIGEEYERVYNLMLKCESPVFFAMGNHDGYIQTLDDGYEYWKAIIGPKYYSFDYGTTHFIALNTYDWNELDRQGIAFGVTAWGGQVREPEMEWLKSDLASCAKKDIVIFSHHTPIWPTEYGYAKNYTEGIPVLEQLDRIAESYMIYGDELWTGVGRDELFGLCSQYPVSAYYAGHVHWDQVNITNWGGHETKFIITTTVSSSTEQYQGYRLVEMRGGEMANYGYDFSADERQQYFGDPNAHMGEETYSIPLCKLNISVESAGLNLNVMSDRAMIENDLNVPIDGLKVRLCVGKGLIGDGELAIGGNFNGKILNVFESEGAYEVETALEIPAHSSGTAYLVSSASLEEKKGVSGGVPGFEVIFAGIAIAIVAFVAKKG